MDGSSEECKLYAIKSHEQEVDGYMLILYFKKYSPLSYYMYRTTQR